MKALRIDPHDSVAVALEPLRAGKRVEVEGEAVELLDPIPRGHKLALCDIKAGSPVIKYGCPIGKAVLDIKKGQHVHTHNVKTLLSEGGEYRYEPVTHGLPPRTGRTFDGFLRSDGSAAIRNEVWIVPTVFCVNHVARELEAYATGRLGSFENVDGCLALTHPYGCSQAGEDFRATQNLLSALCAHPHAACVLVLGLGCENNNLGVFRDCVVSCCTHCSPPTPAMPHAPDGSARVFYLNCQDVEDELEVGRGIVEEMLSVANQAHRTQLPLSSLTIGLKCGGSDGLSGITANPLIGRVSDALAAEGGACVMTEVPEMFGAEQILMNRARDEGVFMQCEALIRDFKRYFTSHGQEVSGNPSPGNKEGGITTLEDKSLGCVQKGGRSPVCSVLRYAERVREKGLSLLQAPGNDGVSSTALAASGCNLILFSTGRGTPFATAVPTLKISSNTALFEKKPGWIDFDAGRVVAGASFEDLTAELLDLVVKTASGHRSKSELRGFHEIVIWKDGVTM